MAHSPTETRLPEILQDFNILTIAASPFDQTNVTLLCESFNIINRGFIELD